MKIAVSSKGTTLQSEVEPRFGRASYLLIIDTDTMDLEVLDNGRNRNALKGAGIQAATIAGEAGVEAVLTGFCGPNAFKVLNTAGIKVVNDVSGSVLDAVVKFKNKGYSFAAEANVEGNW